MALPDRDAPAPVEVTRAAQTERSASVRYWSRRLTRQALLVAAGTVATVLLAAVARERDSFAFRVSFATAYVSLTLLAVSLAIGPVRLLLGRRSPPSIDLRRDIGVSAGLFAIAHVITGLQVHMRGAMWKYFLDPDRGPLTILPRLDGFGLANYSGLAATAIVLLLVAISNDFALRRLGVAPWKRIQRWTYSAAALVAIHGAAYQWVDRRGLVYVLLFAALVATTVCFQVAGVRRTRSVKRRSATSRA